MRVLAAAAIVFINFALQTTLVQSAEVWGATPDTALALVVAYAILREEVEGTIFGFFAGLLRDIFFGRYFGFFALQYCLVGYFCGKPFRDFFKENLFIPVLLTFVSAILCDFTFYVLHFLLLARTDFLRYVKQIILPETIYTVVVSPFIYRMMYGVNRRLEKWENRRKGDDAP